MANSESMQDVAKKPVSRRLFMKTVLGGLLAGTGTYAYSSTIAVHDLVIEQVTVRVPDLAAARNRTRIVVVSDLHAGPRVSISYIERAMRMAADLKPDFLLMPGDLVDSTHSHLDALCDILAPIAAKIPTYASTGNHDFAGHSYPFADRVCGSLGAAGIKVLRNDFHQPRTGPGELCFVGLEDLWSDRFLAAPVARAPSDSTVIVLSHNPDSYDYLVPFRCHLVVSGHTHGGQVCIPGVGPLMLPVHHRERAAGLFHLDPLQPHRALYVTRGVGHLLKVRFFCPPEITCITLEGTA